MAREPNDGLKMLETFHEEVRAHLRRLRELEHSLKEGRRVDSVMASKVAYDVIHCLRHGSVLHELDEAESLIPRLQRKLKEDPECAPELAQELETVELHHADNEAVWLRLRQWLLALVAPDASITAVNLGMAIGAIEQHYLPHFEHEERLVYSSARRLLSAEERACIAEEIRERWARAGSAWMTGAELPD